MEIRINPKKKVLTLIENGKTEVYEFTDIYLGKHALIWKVELVGGQVLILNFKPEG